MQRLITILSALVSGTARLKLLWFPVVFACLIVSTAETQEPDKAAPTSYKVADVDGGAISPMADSSPLRTGAPATSSSKTFRLGRSATSPIRVLGWNPLSSRNGNRRYRPTASGSLTPGTLRETYVTCASSVSMAPSHASSIATRKSHSLRSRTGLRTVSTFWRLS